MDKDAFSYQISSYESQIPCGMVTLGSNISSITGLFDRLRKRVQLDGIAQVAVLESGDAATLKNVLKFLNRTILADGDGEKEDSDSTPDRLVWFSSSSHAGVLNDYQGPKTTSI